MSRRRRSRRIRRKRATRAASAPPAARPSAPAPAPVTPPSPPPLAAEALLLALSRSFAAPAIAKASDLAALVNATAAAYAPDAPLTRALHADWPRVTTDKTAHLAMAWAREQVRLALLEILQRAREAGVLRARTDPDVLAWLWLAACEALAHDAPSAVPDRVQALASFLTGE